jgi:putative hemolysin
LLANGQTNSEGAILTEILVILALVLINGIFAGAEIAVVALRASRLDQLVAGKRRGARAVKALRDDPERFLATVQVGITVIGALTGAFGGATFAKDLAPILQRIPLLERHADSLALGIVVALVSYLSLVLGELVPKSLALRYAEGYALLIGRPLLGLSWIARPLVWFLTASSNVFLRLFGDRTTFTEARLSREELQQLVGEAAKTGSLDPTAGEMAARALDFPELSALQVMVPRTRVIALEREASFDDVCKVVATYGHTRMPVYEKNLDHVLGYVNVKDVFARAIDSRAFTVADVVRPAYVASERTRTLTLLDEMKKRKTQFAIIVDEFGTTSGIVTLEDLVEELVGDVFGEHETPAPENIRREPDGSFLVQGVTPVHDVNRQLDLDLPVGESFSTIAGLCLCLAERLPLVGDRLAAPDGTVIEIVDASQRRVRVVRLFVPAQKKEE